MEVNIVVQDKDITNNETIAAGKAYFPNLNKKKGSGEIKLFDKAKPAGTFFYEIGDYEPATIDAVLAEWDPKFAAD